MNRVFTLLLFYSCLAPALPVSSPPQKIVFLGDSLTEGYEIKKEEAYPSLVETILKTEGRNVICVNAGISGQTSAGGLARLRWQLKNKPDILILALGANDGLKGLSVAEMRKNLKEIISEAQKNGVKVLLAGMKTPLNMGTVYVKEFEEAYVGLAAELKIPLIPFLLKDVATVDRLNLSDRIHPNPEGHKVIAQTVLIYLRPLL